MSEEKSKEKKDKKTAKVILGGKEVTVHKLKAGKFFKAQKVITKLFQEASSITEPEMKKVKTSNEEVERKVAKEKIADMKDVDVAGFVSMFDKFPRYFSKFVAICSDMSHKELLKKAYPEEINDAFEVCLELNNVMENLKNYVAPMKKLGGGIVQNK